jgi:hypothetical protein
VQEKRRALVDQSKKQRAELMVQVERQQHRFDRQGGDCQAFTNDNLMHSSSNIPPHQDTESSQKLYAQMAPRQREQGPQKNIEYTLSSFLNKMERRLDEFSSRLSSQLCDIEKKINLYSDRQADTENIINEIVLPAIQELVRVISQPSKTRNIKEDFSKLSYRINELLVNHKHKIIYRNQQSAPDHIDYSDENGSLQ